MRYIILAPSRKNRPFVSLGLVGFMQIPLREENRQKMPRENLYISKSVKLAYKVIIF